MKNKVLLALKNKLTPIFCIGELKEEREANKQDEVVKAELLGSVFNLSAEEWKNIVLAYEPIWAIGSGKGCTAEDAKVVHAAIRDVLGKKLGKEIAKDISIIYGGSVDQRSVIEYMTTTDIDGVLVGGASLDPRAFGLLCRAANPA